MKVMMEEMLVMELSLNSISNLVPGALVVAFYREAILQFANNYLLLLPLSCT